MTGTQWVGSTAAALILVVAVIGLLQTLFVEQGRAERDRRELAELERRLGERDGDWLERWSQREAR